MLRAFALSALIFALPAAPVLAQDCGERGTAVLSNFYDTGDNDWQLPEGWSRWVQETHCKVWPAHPELTLLAVPVLGPEDERGQSNSGHLDLWAVETATGAVKAQLRLKHLLDSDAVYVSSLSLDTARYRLNEATTAFGVRVSRSGSSRANPMNETTLQLFVLDDDTLSAVSQPLVVSRGGGEWDTNCAGEFYELQRTVAIGPQSAHGHADLIVRESGTSSRQFEQANECESTDTPAPKQQYRLRHDGEKYAVPAALRGLGG